MQILILYYSKSGNTEKLAKKVAEGVNSVINVGALLKSVEKVKKEDFLESEGIIAGSPVYFGTMAAELKKIFDDFVSTRKRMEGKVGAAFTTAGDNSGGKETTIFSIIQAMLIYGMIIAGDPMEATGHYGVSCVGEPGAIECKNGFLLGKRIAEIATQLRK